MNLVRFVYLLHLILAALMAGPVWALNPFVVKDIRVEGAKRIEPGTVFNYLPIKVGDDIDDKIARESIRVLFSTGFFNDIELKQDGDTLVVVVTERPSIAWIKYSGNKDIRDEQVEDVFGSLDFTDGQIFSPRLLDKLVQTLRDSYFARGRYSATVESTVTPLDSNRVGIRLSIDEGRVAVIRKLRIIGNKSFDDSELKKLLHVRQDSWLRFLSSKNKYSKDKLNASLETLRSFYLDHGYMRFKVDSTDVTISQNKQDVFLTINISEGGLYVFGSVALDNSRGLVSESLFVGVQPRSGDAFSRREVVRARAALEDSLADVGYAFANVNAMPEVDEGAKTVNFTFVVDPGPKVYVRRINVRGNLSTRDEVIRREMRQMEGAEYSAQSIRRSKERIQKLGFFDEVSIDTPDVPGTIDQVDVNITVTERPTGNVLFGVGYAGEDGAILQAEVNRENLFGSGREIKFKFDNSKVNQVYEVAYTNPYFTKDGVSLGYFFEYEDVDTAETISADYVSKKTSVGIRTRIPVTEFNSFKFSAGYEQLDLEITATTPSEYKSFISDNPDNENLALSGGVTKDTRDSIFYPRKGYLRRAMFEFTSPGSDLEYYKLTLRGRWYRPLAHSLTMSMRGAVGYGSGYGNLDDLPFFQNYYAGGTRTVRGYDARSLGPRTTDSFDDPLGGSKQLTATTEIFFPVPGMKDSADKRLSFFVDGGQVYAPSESVDLGELRYSAGVAFSWFTAVGPLSLSYAMPFNDDSTDDIKKLQFTLGMFFR